MNVVAEFKNDGTEWSASNQLEAWCKENDFAIGSTQRDSPQGLMKGRDQWDIARWRDLDAQERAELDGVVEWFRGGPRSGDCVVKLKSGQAS